MTKPEALPTPQPHARPRWWPFALGGALVLAGCASSDGLNSQGRLLAAPQSLPATLTPAADARFSRTWPGEDWWHALNDPQLDTLVQQALQGNPDLAAADARLRQAGAQAELSDAQRGTAFTAQAMVQDVRLPGSLLPGGESAHMRPKVLGINASHEFDVWGGERAAWEAALGRQRAAEVDARAARLLLSVDVTRTYTALGYSHELRDLYQQDQARARQVLELTRQRVQAGIDGQAQQHQAEAVLASASQRLAQADQQINAQRSALAVLLGQGPEQAAQIQRPAPVTAPALHWPDALPADLLGRRPDIVAARWRVQAAQSDIDAARTRFYPSFNLTAAAGLASMSVSDLLSLNNRYVALLPAVSLPLFDSGRLRANLSARNADYDAAVAQYNKTLVAAFNQVALQMQTAQSLQTQVQAEQQAVDAARLSWTLAQQRYQRGVGSYVEVLSVQQTVLSTEALLAQLQHQQVDSAIQLIRALGGGYRPDPEHQNNSTKAAS